MQTSKILKALIGMVYHKKPRTIRNAIYKISHSSLLEQIPVRHAEEELIELVSKLANCNSETLQQKISEAIGLRYIDDLHLPTKELLKIIGLSVETLKNIPAIPQIINDNNYLCALIVANTEKISIEDFHRAGIAIALGSSKAIKERWSSYDAILAQETSELRILRLKNILEKIVQDIATKHKINSLVIYKNQYSFESRGRNYKGNLQKEICEGLNSLLVHVSSYRFTNSTVENLEICKSAQSQSIELRWSKKRTSARSSKLWQTENTLGIKAKVLLIDDSLTYRSVVTEILKEKGFDVCTQANGDEALRFLAKENYQPDLIICDVHMPVLNGAEFVKKMRDFGASTPILMLTSDENSSTEIMLAEIGADACVKKSEDPQILIAWCRRLTRKLSLINNQSKFNKNLKKQIASR